ncbi:MAG: hypothetical protein FWD54_01005 [Endomicrobia bacterium]|nr:hypothetical protein [Endomicrobiia bacterium]MCL2798851.1 hypothetical protein [Endomicrobiia bacterium]
MFEKLENILETDFEKALFKEAINNLNLDSKIRFSNFAYAVRELLDVFLEREAPDEFVMKCSWYEKPNNIDRDVVRGQRIRYIISGGLPDEFFDESLSKDVSEINQYISRGLSKYVHIRKEEYLTLSKEEINNKVYEFIEVINTFIDRIEDTKNRIIQLLERNIYDILTERESVLSELDCLSTHTRIEGISYLEVEIIDIDYSTIECTINGMVEVELQYGSDGDVRRGDGCVSQASYPFELGASYITIPRYSLDKKDLERSIVKSLKEKEIQVDTSSFYK